jgi:hypothetical protein
VLSALRTSSSRRPRRARLAVVGAVFALVLTSCSTNNGPKDYNDAVKDNYTNSCKEANPDKKDITDAATFCGCTYEAIKTSFSFDEFKALDAKLRDALDKKDTAPKNEADIAKLDARYATAVEACRTAGPSAPASNASTTTVATTTTK